MLKKIQTLLLMSAVLAAPVWQNSLTTLPVLAQGETATQTEVQTITPEGATGPASITILGNAQNQDLNLSNRTFDLYQILVYTQSTVSSTGYEYAFNPNYASIIQKVIETSMTENGYTVPDKGSDEELGAYQAVEYLDWLNNQSNDDYRTFVYQLKNALDDSKPTYNISTSSLNLQSGQDVKIAGLDYGFYIIFETTDGSALEEQESVSGIIATKAAPNAKISLKPGTVITPEKTVKNNNLIHKSASADGEEVVETADDFEKITNGSIGDVLTFKVETPDIENLDRYEKFTLNFYDTLSSGLSLNADSVKLEAYVNTQTTPIVFSESDYEVDAVERNQSFVVQIPDLIKALNTKLSSGDTVKVVMTYEATIKSEQTSLSENNTVYLEYSNDPAYPDNLVETPIDEADLVGFKLELTKIDNKGNQLSGAQFELYEETDQDNHLSDGDTLISFVAPAEGSSIYTVAPSGTENTVSIVESGTDGIFTLGGLGEGIYYLKETKAPDGYEDDYVGLKTEVTITISNVEYQQSEEQGNQALKSFEITFDYYDANGDEQLSTITVNSNNSTGTGGSLGSLQDHSASFKIINWKEGDVADSGGKTLIYIGGAAIAIFALAFLVRPKKSRA